MKINESPVAAAPHVSSGAIHFRTASDFDVPLDDLWAFHMRPEALTLLSPPLSGFRVVDRGAGVANGSVLRAEVGRWPLKRDWVALHAAVEPYQSFTDVALESPFPYWVHVHVFEAIGEGRSRLTDSVWFVPPRPIGRTLGRIVVEPLLRLMFSWRHRVTRRETENNAKRRSVLRNQNALCGQGVRGGPS